MRGHVTITQDPRTGLVLALGGTHDTDDILQGEGSFLRMPGPRRRYHRLPPGLPMEQQRLAATAAARALLAAGHSVRLDASLEASPTGDAADRTMRRRAVQKRAVARDGLRGFTKAVGMRLPGAWSSDDRAIPLDGDPAGGRLWDTGPLNYTAYGQDAHRSVLTSRHGMQLHVAEHPTRAAQFVVSPLLPAGTGPADAVGVRAPRAITVAADPVRAAADIRRRQLFAFRIASAQVQTKASPGPDLPVEIVLGSGGRPRVSTVYPRALYELLTAGGFRLDPASGQCFLPRSISSTDASHRVLRTARRLDRLGFSIRVRTADSIASHDRRRDVTALPKPPPPAGPRRGPH
ncbi:hypothetical protein ACFXP3_01325 [Streptomyces sp. NPDC059096]|uniref:hypothetical protein n=1 Tax=Streptomyces sp. NPDC059096 TaxID=3346727 RepID=UPI0036A6EF26